jgi:hypothetical protein
MRPTRFRPSHGTVVAYLALFVALGGTTYAATGGNLILGQPNSADTTTSLTARVVDTGLTAPALRVTNLAPPAGATALGLRVASGHPPFAVNSGTKVANLNADKLDGQDSGAFARNGSAPWREVGAAGQPPFNDNGVCVWRNFDTGAPAHNSAAFLRDRFGFVHLKGLVRHTGGCTFANPSNMVIFNLPVGYRPARREVLATITNGALGRVNVDGPAIDPNQGAGAVFVEPPTTEANAQAWLSLDGISFRCAPSGSNGCP